MLDTLSNVKSRLGIADAAYDTFLTQQITLISDVIEAYCRRKFNATSWVQTFYKEDMEKFSTLSLYQYPVIQVDDITIDDEAVDLDTVRIHKPTALLKKNDGSDFYGDEIVVEYVSGYASVPAPILSVLDTLVEERYNKKKSGVNLNFGSDVQRISIPGAISLDFDYSLTNNERKNAYGVILGSQVNVLDDWRSERAVVGSGKLEYLEESGPAVVDIDGIIPISKKEDITLDATNITNQYVDLLHEIEDDSLDLTVDSVMQYEGLDYSLSTVGGVTRLTFLGQLATGGTAELLVGDVIHVTYRY